MTAINCSIVYHNIYKRIINGSLIKEAKSIALGTYGNLYQKLNATGAAVRKTN